MKVTSIDTSCRVPNWRGVCVPAALLTAAAATNRIAAAGTLLTHADALYASVRRQLAASAGHPSLPRSVWVNDPQSWGENAVAAQIDLLATSPTLVSSHYLVLRTVALDPPALPAPPGQPAGTSTLSPTNQIGVDVVLANQGSVNEPHGTVRYTLTDESTGASSTQVRSAPVAVGASVSLPTVNFGVKSGTFYVLTVSVVLPAAQAVTAGTVLQRTLQVAPGT